MSHRLIQRLARLRQEFEAAGAVLRLANRIWPSISMETEVSGTALAAIRVTAANLEATYLIRLFAEFEALLRDAYPSIRPGTTVPARSAALIDQIGARLRIPTAVRADVHLVRSYRNGLAHGRQGARPVSFSDALSSLNRYLAWLPG